MNKNQNFKKMSKLEMMNIYKEIIREVEPNKKDENYYFSQERAKKCKNNINLLSQWLQLKLIKRNCQYINYIKSKKNDFYIKSLNIDIYSLEYIKNPDEKLQTYVVNNYPEQLALIHNPVLKVEKILLKNFNNIQEMKKPSKKIQLYMIKSATLRKAINNTNDILNKKRFTSSREIKALNHYNTMLELISNKNCISELLYFLYINLQSESIRQIIEKHKNFRGNASLILHQMKIINI